MRFGELVFKFIFSKKEGDQSLLARKNELGLRIAVIFIILAVPYVVIFRYLHMGEIEAMVIATIGFLSLSIVFNRVKAYSISKALLVIGPALTFFGSANILGPEAGAQFLLFTLVALPLLLFDITQIVWILLCMMVPMSAHIALELGRYDWLPHGAYLDPKTLLYIRCFVIVTTFLLLVLSGGAYFLSNRRYELKLEEKNQELESSNHQLQTAYEDLQLQQNLLEKSWHDSVYAQLTRTIAHELKNPLFEFGMVIGALEKSLDDRETAMMFISSLATTIEELMELVNAMLESGGASVGEYKEIRISEVMNRVLILAEGSIKKRNIQLTKDIADVPAIMGDSKAFLMIFSNLIVNAMEAMDEVAAAALTVRVMADPSPHAGRQGVMVEISDTGVGIPKSRQEGLFKGGQSTKGIEERQRGIGLGLVWKLIDQMGGEITVHSDPDVAPGTMFRIVV